jgi:glycolate oxidase FAD binding subunit
LRLKTGVDAFYDWQGGLVWLRMEADPDADLVRKYIKALGRWPCHAGSRRCRDPSVCSGVRAATRPLEALGASDQGSV